MLFSFIKYSNATKYNKVYMNSNTTKKNLIASTFNKKHYFRSLLFYLNIIYACLSTPIDCNYFYSGVFFSIYYGRFHPSFYFKKNIIK
jgi:hypothetical protein